MLEAFPHEDLVPFDGRFRLDRAPTGPPKKAPGKKELVEELGETVEELRDLHEVLYAADRVALLVIFQAMDAAGKDGTIRAVLTGLNPAGCQVYSFKRPSDEELDHDFLWRHTCRLPERGRIGIFNRSWYEEVLAVRVHPEHLERQKLPWRPKGDAIWQERLESIADHEKHLARNGVAVVKFFLNVSKEEQRERLLKRIDDPSRRWKFEAGDVDERARWDDYQRAYEAALNATSRPWAPWYAIPADSKPWMRLQVAKVLLGTLRSFDLRVPALDDHDRGRLAELRARLAADG